jgi:hypothetical protein
VADFMGRGNRSTTTSKNTTTYFGWGTDQEMCFGGLIFYPEENVVSKHYCYSWFKIPHCIVNEAMSILQNNKQDYFLFTLGVRSIMKHLLFFHYALTNHLPTSHDSIDNTANSEREQKIILLIVL